MLQEISTNVQQPQVQEETKPETTITRPKDLKFSHFENRYRVRLTSEEIICTRISSDGSLVAVSFADSQLKIISTVNGETLFHIQDKDLPYPVFSMSWKPSMIDS